MLKPKAKTGTYQINCALPDGNLLRQLRMMSSLLGRPIKVCIAEALGDWIKKANQEFEATEDVRRNLLKQGQSLERLDDAVAAIRAEALESAKLKNDDVPVKRSLESEVALQVESAKLKNDDVPVVEKELVAC